MCVSVCAALLLYMSSWYHDTVDTFFDHLFCAFDYYYFLVNCCLFLSFSALSRIRCSLFYSFPIISNTHTLKMYIIFVYVYWKHRPMPFSHRYKQKKHVNKFNTIAQCNMNYWWNEMRCFLIWCFRTESICISTEKFHTQHIWNILLFFIFHVRQFTSSFWFER